MITDACPTCGTPFTLPHAMGKLPIYEQHDCPRCAATIWTIHSLVHPISYTENEFDSLYVVDAEQKVRLRVFRSPEDDGRG